MCWFRGLDTDCRLSRTGQPSLHPRNQFPVPETSPKHIPAISFLSPKHQTAAMSWIRILIADFHEQDNPAYIPAISFLSPKHCGNVLDLWFRGLDTDCRLPQTGQPSLHPRNQFPVPETHPRNQFPVPETKHQTAAMSWIIGFGDWILIADFHRQGNPACIPAISFLSPKPCRNRHTAAMSWIITSV